METLLITLTQEVKNNQSLLLNGFLKLYVELPLKVFTIIPQN